MNNQNHFQNQGQPVSYRSVTPENNPYANPAAPKAAKSKGNGKLILGIVIGFLMAAVMGAGAMLVYLEYGQPFKASNGTAVSGYSSPDDSTTEALDGIIDNIAETPITDTTVPEGEGVLLTYAQVAEKMQPSVCTILSYYYSSLAASGSGFILSEDGYIVTNAHVVHDEEYPDLEIAVKVYGRNEEYPAVIIGYDTKSDVALLKIDTTGLVPAEIGDSNALVVGDEVVAIGTPLDEAYAGTVTNGIVSGLDRIIDSSDTAVAYIQTNAAINPGNSGGPLVNMYGQVVGINTAKIVEEGYEGMGFSIPMASILDIIEGLHIDGYIRRPALGIICITITRSDSQYFDIPRGVQIVSVARASGLAGKVEPGDIITAINGVAISDTADLQVELSRYSIDEVIEVTLFRPQSADSESFTYTTEIVLVSDAVIDYDDLLE